MSLPWHERIALARIRGEFTDEDVHLASDWTTCACGEQDERIPRAWVLRGGFPEMAPADQLLRDLGGLFYEAVDFDRFDDAEDLLRRIEIRSSEILIAVSTEGA